MTTRCEQADELQKSLFKACCYRFNDYNGGKPTIRTTDVRFFIEPNNSRERKDVKSKRTEGKIWDAYLEDLFRLDCVKPLTRGSYGHPYLMKRRLGNGKKQYYVLKFMFYGQHGNSGNNNNPLKRRRVSKKKKDEEEEHAAEEKDRPENADVLINTLLSQEVRNGHLPFINLPVASFVCSEARVRDLMMRCDPQLRELRESVRRHRQQQQQQQQQRPQNREESEDEMKLEEAEQEWLGKFWQHLGRNRMQQTGPGVLVYVAEYASMGSLTDFIGEHPCDTEVWRSILAQCFYILNYVQHKWPDFRHNDLHAANILLEQVPQSFISLPWPNENENENTTLVIDNHALEVRFWDFDYACIAGIYENRKVDSGSKYGISKQKNWYYDLHTLCNNILNDFDLPSEVQAFLYDIVPLHLRYPTATRFGRLKMTDHLESITAGKILTDHAFFAPFRPLL